MNKKYSPLIFSILMIIVGFFNAPTLIERVRLVDILIVFFTGFGAGAGLVKTVLDFRAGRKTKIQPDDMT
jgi:uncharacterized membrane protein YiaA